MDSWGAPVPHLNGCLCGDPNRDHYAWIALAVVNSV